MLCLSLPKSHHTTGEEKQQLTYYSIFFHGTRHFVQSATYRYGVYLNNNNNNSYYIAKILVMSPIVTNVPARELMDVERKSSFLSLSGNLNNKNSVSSLLAIQILTTQKYL